MSPSDWFVHAAALPVLVLVPLAFLALRALERRGARRLQRAVGPRVHALAPGYRPRRRALRTALFALALLLALTAALGPLLGSSAAEFGWRGVDVVVCLDVSRSMWARDVEPDRLTRAQREIRSLAERAEGDRLALVVFAGEARLAVPLTADGATLADLADLADPAAVRRGGTDVGAALDVALAALADGSGEQGAILLVTDGEDLGARGLEAAGRCRARGVPVYCLGMGTRRGSKITLPGAEGEVFLRDRTGTEVVSRMDAGALERLARATGGQAVEVGSGRGALAGLHEAHILPMARTVFASKERRRRDNGYQWLLLGAWLLWMLEAALGDRDPSMSARPPLLLRPSLRGVLGALPLLALAGCGQPGARAYESARSALAAGRFEVAVAAMEEAVEAGGAPFEPLRSFVRGNAAFARSVELEAASRPPRSDPEALKGALKLAEDALAYWQAAAASRATWPEARRNAERGLLWLHALREKRKAGARRRIALPGTGPGDGPSPGGPPRPEPPPPPVPDGAAPQAPPDGSTKPETADLPAGRVLGLLDLVQAKERQRRALRRMQRRRAAAGVERDW